MKVLLIGGGGREHALGWKIAQSPELSKLYLAPGNPGLNQFGSPVNLTDTDIDGITKFAVEKSIDLVVVGPEAPLALGLGDKIRAAALAIAKAARGKVSAVTQQRYDQLVAAIEQDPGYSRFAGHKLSQSKSAKGSDRPEAKRWKAIKLQH